MKIEQLKMLRRSLAASGLHVLLAGLALWSARLALYQ